MRLETQGDKEGVREGDIIYRIRETREWGEREIMYFGET